MPQTPDAWRNDAEAERWEKIEEVLVFVTTSLERSREKKEIGGALQAAVRVRPHGSGVDEAFTGIDAAEVFRTSRADLTPSDEDGAVGARVDVRLAQGEKCARCWRILPEVHAPRFLCERCDAAVAEIEGQA